MGKPLGHLFRHAQPCCWSLIENGQPGLGLIFGVTAGSDQAIRSEHGLEMTYRSSSRLL